MNFANVNSMLNIHVVMGVTARIFTTEKSLCQEQNLSQLSFKKFRGARIQSEFSLFLETNLSHIFWTKNFLTKFLFSKHLSLIPNPPFKAMPTDITRLQLFESEFFDFQ
jgi:hypothetical protein